MTQNAKMRDPGNRDVEKDSPDWSSVDLAKAKKRMGTICAGPQETMLYRYNPNGARNNRHPGVPLEDYPVDD